MSRAIATALLGAGLCLTGGAFDTASLYLPGVTLLLVVLLGSIWVLLAASGARVARLPTPPTEPERHLECRIGRRRASAGCRPLAAS